MFCDAQKRYWSKQLMQNSFWRFSGAPFTRGCRDGEERAQVSQAPPPPLPVSARPPSAQSVDKIDASSLSDCTFI